MYEMLGISLTSFKKDNQQLINLDSENEKSFEEIPKQDPEDEAILTSEDEEVVEDNKKLSPRRSNEYNNELVKKNDKELVQQVVSIYEPPPGPSTSNPNIVKKPFLRRGSGLTSRFGVSPEVFNLKNLPPYKYNERVKKTLGRSSSDAKRARRKSEPIVKVPEVSAKQVEQIQTKNAETRKSEPPPKPHKTIETVELIKVSNDQPITETPKNNMKVPKGISWAQILSENNILSCQVDAGANESCGNLMDDTELFAILENKISGNCSENSVAELMDLLAQYQARSNAEEEEEDDTLVRPDDPMIKEVPSGKKELFPKPQDLELSQSETTFDESEDDESSQKVRFAPSVEVCDENTGVSGMLLQVELSMFDLQILQFSF